MDLSQGAAKLRFALKPLLRAITEARFVQGSPFEDTGIRLPSLILLWLSQGTAAQKSPCLSAVRSGSRGAVRDGSGSRSGLDGGKAHGWLRAPGARERPELHRQRFRQRRLEQGWLLLPPGWPGARLPGLPHLPALFGSGADGEKEGRDLSL